MNITEIDWTGRIQRENLKQSAKIGGSEGTDQTNAPGWSDVLKQIQEKKDSEAKVQKPCFDSSQIVDKIEHEKKAPYSYMAKNGVIEYNGVTFNCDDEKQQISLGDISNPDEVLSIPLEKGGRLVVNRNCIGSLSKAISMFSPGDIKRILSAIAKDTQCTQKIYEIDEMESGEGLFLDAKS